MPLHVPGAIASPTYRPGNALSGDAFVTPLQPPGFPPPLVSPDAWYPSQCIHLAQDASAFRLQLALRHGTFPPIWRQSLPRLPRSCCKLSQGILQPLRSTTLLFSLLYSSNIVYSNLFSSIFASYNII